MINYEYPLNERIRTLLQLEDAFARAACSITQASRQEHHAALLALFEIVEIAGRADLKSDLIQELERQKKILELLPKNPAISEDALNTLLQDIDKTIAGLNGMTGKVGQHMRDNEWLMHIKQRADTTGGVRGFDLPSYHYWLNQDAELRSRELASWLEPMLPINDGIRIVMRALRDSGKGSRYVAPRGSFQQMLSGQVVQMLRVRLADSLPCFPEISANKYAINISYAAPGRSQKPRACEQDVEFEMMLCSL
ncbi:MAG: cell division protein ZapD [Sulfuricella sp.]|nr:cell division protein ZapD [Sulfuricella sp.]